MQIPFATESYKHRSLPISAQRCVNAYAEKEPQGAKTQIAVLGMPGLTLFTTVGSGPIRGMHLMGGVLFVVSGMFLYQVNSNGTSTLLGGQVTGTNTVSMADNGTQVIVVNGVSGWVWSAVAGFQTINSINFFPSSSVVFFDSYFVLSRDGTNQFFISSILDGTTYNGLDFASAEVSSDLVLAIVNQQENLLIFGQRTIETWYDAGAVQFPFLRVDAGTIERGTAAALTPIKEDNGVFFLGDDIVFYRLDGTQLRRISQHAIEEAWQMYTTVSDAYTFSYTFEGHKFIVLQFPSANATWVYDISTGLWHERESWDLNNNSYGKWRGAYGIFAYNNVLIGDAFSGQIGFIDETVATEFGNTTRLLMVSPVLHQDRKRLFHFRFELDMESGVGITSGQGSDPQAMLDWSDDGGRTFKNFQLWHSIGKIGAYTQRLRWLRLGQARQRYYRLTISDPVRRTVIAASADIEVGV
jgi:Phage stabilisation protein